MSVVSLSSLRPSATVPAGAVVLITIPLPQPLTPDERRTAEMEIQSLGLHHLYRLLACAILPEQVLVLIQSGPTPFQALLNLLRARLAQKIQHLLAPYAATHTPTFTATVIPDAQALRLRTEVQTAARQWASHALCYHTPLPVAMAA